jgi:large-conductance mechanosensitive channel
MEGGAMGSRRLLITVAVAFVVGSALKDFFSAMTTGLVTPIVASLFPGVQASVAGLTLQVGGVKLEVGSVISATATLVISLLVVSLTLPYIKAYAPIRGAARSA